MTSSPSSNNPPSNIEFTDETYKVLNDWLTEHPVVQTEEEAREGKLLVDRAFQCLGELEAERDSKVRPLNEQVRSINDEYREPSSRLKALTGILGARITQYAVQEEIRRHKETEKARKEAEEAWAKAKAAAASEEAKAEEATEGVTVDLGEAIQDTSRALKDFVKAERNLLRAEKAEHVKIGGGFRRALSLREKETLLVTDVWKAIDKLGWTNDMLTAIIKAARVYRKLHGELPPGIESQIDRSI